MLPEGVSHARKDSGSPHLPGWGEGYMRADANTGCIFETRERKRHGMCPLCFEVNAQAWQGHGQTGAFPTPRANVQN